MKEGMIVIMTPLKEEISFCSEVIRIFKFYMKKSQIKGNVERCAGRTARTVQCRFGMNGNVLFFFRGELSEWKDWEKFIVE